MTEAIRKAVALLPRAKLCLDKHGYSEIGFTKPELKTLIAALEDMQGVAERHQFEIDTRDNIINSKTKLLADERAEVERLKPLARRGAAVKWRPIEEAPKDGEFVIIVEASGYKHVGQFCESGYWRGNILDKSGTWKPAHFIPLSALGEPET
jgi:hypothetical protein